MNALTELAIRQTKAPQKSKKLSDGGGLILLLHPNGGKYWRFNYRFGQKQKTISMGTYPEVSLKQARDMRAEFRMQLQNGIEPMTRDKAEEVQTELVKQYEFATVAKSWWEAQQVRWKPKHAKTVWHSLEVDVLPAIGQKDIRSLKAPNILAILREVESRNVNDTALRILQRIKCIFNYGIQTGLIEQNPALPLTGVIVPKKRSTSARFAAKPLIRIF